MTDSPMNEAARAEAALRYPPAERDRAEVYPLAALREHKAAAFASGARWQRGRLRTDEAVESAAQALYGQVYRNMSGYSWTAATEAVRNEYRVLARATLDGAIEMEEP